MINYLQISYEIADKLKSIRPFLHPELLLKILTIAKLLHTASKIWTFTEPVI